MTLGRTLALAAAVVLNTGCGGGGGGGGGSSHAGPTPADAVSFTGFSFRSGSGASTTVPPMEDPAANPPALGAGLNLVVIFHFDGVPSAPLDGSSLPIYTTPGEVTPAAGPPGTVAALPAKGTYVLVVAPGQSAATVEFRPFVPSGSLSLELSSPAETVPGLLPGSVYTAAVSTELSSAIGNLQGAGGQVKFGTTSNPAAYYPVDAADSAPPTVVLTDPGGGLLTTPADGAGNFAPATFSRYALGSDSPTFPDGPDRVDLVFSGQLLPTESNVQGSDLDGDDVLDQAFFLRGQSTRLIIGHQVPAGAVAGGGPHAAFGAVSALRSGSTGDVTGGDVLFQDSQDGALALPASSAFAPVKALASGRDSALLYLIQDVPGGADRILLADHLLGDPTAAQLGLDAPGGSEISFSTGAEDLVGLLELQSGRLLGFDKTTRTVMELELDLLRQRPSPTKPSADAPLLLGVASPALGSTNLFQSLPWPAGLDVVDLAQAPSGRLFALGTLDGNVFPSLVEIAQVDPDLDGESDPGEGEWSGSVDDILTTFESAVAALEFLSETRVVVLDRDSDSLDEIHLGTGARTGLAAQIAGFDSLAPGDLSPASCLALGHMQVDVLSKLVSNGPEGAVVQLTPWGVLPLGIELQVMQRFTVTSLSGFNGLNAHPGVIRSPLGAVQVLAIHTADPMAGSEAPVSDVVLEEFDDVSLQDAHPQSGNPPAEWGPPVQGTATTSVLRASLGASEVASLGDFLPSLDLEWKAKLAYLRTSASLGEPSLDLTRTSYRVVVLDTDSQFFPLSDGSTPGISQPRTVMGGQFVFRDVIIPEGVHVIARGSHPLRITATGRVEIDGVLDVRGTDGLSDDTFNSGFLPVPGGVGGPGAGRGGDGHPTLSDPSGTGGLNQYVTPETGERGWGPKLDGVGGLSFSRIGGHGGLTTLGYEPTGQGYPKLDEFDNREEHRPPGGGGGSFRTLGDVSHQGTGTYRIQSSSTWFPFSKCNSASDSISRSLYGNEEQFWQNVPGTKFLQCAYLLGTPAAPERFQPGAQPGDAVFKDESAQNDYIGMGGELAVVMGGQGGGGGGSRADSIRKRLWSADNIGSPENVFGIPHYPKLFFGLYFSPTLYDAKAGAGGGGGGAVHLRAYGDVRVGRFGHIDARGGHGGGGEVVQNANFAAGGGGGSGGAVIIQAAGQIVVEADAHHRAASYVDPSGAHGASIEVSGGFGRDARSDPTNKIDFLAMTFDSSRSDGGQGGMGIVQLQPGGSAGLPQIQEGAYVFAKKRAVLKLGPWTGDNAKQEAHPSWATPPPGGSPPDDLRYIEMLHYRAFTADGASPDRYLVLNGAFPPVISSLGGDNGSGLAHEYPVASGQFWSDTAMMSGPLSGHEWVVRDPEPHKLMKTYLGWDPLTFEEPFWKSGAAPGELHAAGSVLPMSVHLQEPSGLPYLMEVDGEVRVDPTQLVHRLPLVHPLLAPSDLGSVSQGTSVWLPFSGATLRDRDNLGRTPPFFAGINGTHNGSTGLLIPEGALGRVRLGGPVPGAGMHARFVLDAGADDPGLFAGDPVGAGTLENPAKNDIKVDALDAGIGVENVVTDNAHVSLWFQGAYAVRPGSAVPDAGTLTEWVADPRVLDGYPLVRFRVEFDLAANPEAFPFGLESKRPAVDVVRLRVEY